MENPFSYSSVVTGESFCNRKKEQRDLIYYAQNAQNILLYSHRRMGKTSLIHQVIQRLKNTRPKVKSVYIDLYGTLDEAHFIDALLTGLAQIESRLEKLLKMVAGLKVTGGFDPLTGLPALTASIMPGERPGYLEKALQILASYAEKQKLMVAFDEFQEIAKYSSPGFEKRLRKMIQCHRNISYIFCGSQQHLLIRMFDSANRAFYKMARSYPLQNIEMGHYRVWAKKLFQKKNITIDDNIITAIVERCEYQPMYIQQFLFDLWRSNVIDMTVLETIQRSVISSQKNQFAVLWNLLTLNQKKVLRLIAATGGKRIYTAQCLQQAGLNSGSVLQRALSALIEKDILSKNGHYRFQDVIFKKWIQSLS